MAGQPDGPRAHDADWILAQRGDREAFERLYREHVGRIHGMARRMAGPDVADDLTQEIFIRVWQKLGSFRGDSGFGTWLHRLAVNWILSKRAGIKRWDSRHVSAEGALGALRSKPKTPGLRLDFEGAIADLPSGARRVFVLYDVEGYTHKEISGLLEISVGTSKSQLHRARMLLREVLA